jgi:hypothetical protein
MDIPVLSTMVVLYKVNLKIDTNKMVSDMPLEFPIIKIEKRGFEKRGESKRDKIKRRSKKDSAPSTTGFCHNSITVVVLNNGDGALKEKEITIKIFQNGIFHLTGVLHDLYDQCSMRILLNDVWTKCKHCIIDPPETYEILNRRVVLMNYTTSLTSGDTVARESLHNTINLLNEEHLTSHYDPDVYPGVKICLGPHKWTAKIFRTGKIILTGITSSEEMTTFVERLSDLLEKVLPSKPTLKSPSKLLGLP